MKLYSSSQSIISQMHCLQFLFICHVNIYPENKLTLFSVLLSVNFTYLYLM
jgi:hypothetical protein